jgi:hypothetical protein
MRLLVPAVSVLCLAVLVPPAAARGIAPLVVNAASAEDGLLTIRGGGFGATPSVTLAGSPLVVISSTSEEILAELPRGAAPGSYRLLVSRNPLGTGAKPFEVTIGAVGPRGDQGPQGPPGLQGPPGPDVTDQIAVLQGLVIDLNTRLAALETKLAHVSVAGDNIYIDGANLYVRSGSGSTDGPVNGLGNLVIGYNQGRGPGLDDRTGSHNLIVGSKHNFSSYGGIVAGLQGGITTPYSTAIFGQSFDLRSTGAFAVKAMTLNLETEQSAQVKAGSNLDMRASSNLVLRAGGTGELFATSTLSLRGSSINLN